MNIHSYKYSVTLLTLLILLFNYCTTDVGTGGSTEVGNPAISGTLLTNSKSFAEDAKISIYLSNSKGGSTPLKTSTTNKDGKYHVKFTKAEFESYKNSNMNIYAYHIKNSDTLYLLHQDISFNTEDKNVGIDTLHSPGSISGKVSISETSETNVHISGSPYIIEIENDGSFAIDNLPPGNYNLEIVNDTATIDTVITDIEIISDTVKVLDPIIITLPSWSIVGTAGFSADSTIRAIEMKVHNHEPYVLYIDSTLKLTAKKYNGSNWFTFGSSERFTPKIAGNFSFIIDQENGTPYVAFVEDSSKNVIVMKYQNSDWEILGDSPGNYSSIGVGYAVSMDIYNQEPYVTFVYTDNGAPPAHQCITKRFNNNSWIQFGPGVPDTLQTPVAYPNLVIDKTNQNAFIVHILNPVNNSIAVAQSLKSDTTFQIGNNFASLATQFSLAIEQNELYIASLIPGFGGNAPDEVIVLNYNGSSLIDLGEAVESDTTYTTIESISFDVDQSEFYVAYTEGPSTAQKRGTVKKLTDNNWHTLGNITSFADSASNYVSLDVDNGVPWIAFQDYANEGKVTVKKFQ